MDPEDTLYWRIGPLHLWITRRRTEWRVVQERTGDPLDTALTVAEPADLPAESPTRFVSRFGFTATDEQVELRPRLADRPVIVNPATPFRIPPGEQVRVFVSTPLWFEIRAGRERKPLVDEPIFRPSDTWFGPSTREGEFCYADKTSARMTLDSLPQRPQRAMAGVWVQNPGRTSLPLERLRVPFPLLSLFESPSGLLWTEAITLTREEDGQSAALELESKPPPDLIDASPLSPPRLESPQGYLHRTFGGLFELAERF